MSISLKGYNQNCVTLIAAGGLKKGDLVKISANNTAAPCAASNVPCGICLSTDGKYACIQLQGYAKVKYTGTAPALGSAIIAAGSANTVKTATAGKNVLVVNVTAADTTAEIIF